MSDAAQLAEQALTALNAQNYQEAINLYTSALETFPAALEYYIKRSTAHQRNAQYNEALRDAEIACMLGKQRGKRESTGNAQLRRAISLYMLEQYGDAGFCFTLAKRYAPNEKSIEMWQKRLEMAMAKLDEEDFRREVTVKEIPEVEIPRNAPKVAEKPAKEKSAPADEVLAPTPPPPEGVVTPRSKIRHEWYQTNTHTVITLYVKGVPKDKATIVIQESSVAIFFPLPGSTEFTFDLDPLFAPINPSASTSTILSTKIELSLAKATPSQKWPSLEAPDGIIDKMKPTGASGDKLIPEGTKTLTSAAAVGPAYPTSSKKGPKNWDALANELTRKPKKPSTDGQPEGDSGGDGDYDLDDDEGDPVNSFFKKLYKDADEDTRRAMMKSYVESNGTALSTNWGEVGKGKVETSPPEGLVVKNWDE